MKTGGLTLSPAYIAATVCVALFWGVVAGLVFGAFTGLVVGFSILKLFGLFALGSYFLARRALRRGELSTR